MIYFMFRQLDACIIPSAPHMATAGPSFVMPSRGAFYSG
jgi:hypothetical protein